MTFFLRGDGHVSVDVSFIKLSGVHDFNCDDCVN